MEIKIEDIRSHHKFWDIMWFVLKDWRFITIKKWYVRIHKKMKWTADTYFFKEKTVNKYLEIINNYLPRYYKINQPNND